MADVSAADSPDRVLVRTAGGVGRLTLNRPEAINAADVGMVETILATLRAFAAGVDVVVQGTAVRVARTSTLDLGEVVVPGDPSSAAFATTGSSNDPATRTSRWLAPAASSVRRAPVATSIATSAVR